MSIPKLLQAWTEHRELYGVVTPEERLAFPNNQKGRKALDKAIAAKRRRPDAATASRWRELADAFLAANRLLCAHEIYDGLAQLEPGADVYAQRGLASLGMFFFDDAVADFKTALEYDAGHPVAKKGLARARKRKGPDHDVVIAFRKEVLVPLAEIAVEARNARALDKALMATELIIELDDDEMGWRLRSEVLDSAGRRDEAIQCAERALDLGAYHQTRTNYGIMLFERGDHEAALAAFTRVAKLVKTNTWARHWKTYTLHTLGRQDEVDKEAKSAARAIAKLGEKATAKNDYEVAAMLALTPQLDKGLDALQRAVEMNPEFAKQAQTDDDLARLRTLDRFAEVTGG